MIAKSMYASTLTVVFAYFWKSDLFNIFTDFETLKVNFQKPEGEPAGDEVASDLLVAASPPSPPPPPPVLESPDQIFGVKIKIN